MDPGGSTAVLEKKKKKVLGKAGSGVSVVFTFIGPAGD